MKMNEDCKYLAVEVSKQMFTTVYFKVPKDFDEKNIDKKMLISAVQVLSPYAEDWDGTNWRSTLEKEDVTEVSEHEAESYYGLQDLTK